jgi:hypothetical protein
MNVCAHAACFSPILMFKLTTISVLDVFMALYVPQRVSTSSKFALKMLPIETIGLVALSFVAHAVKLPLL